MNSFSVSVNGTSNIQLNNSLKNTLDKIEDAHSFSIDKSRSTVSKELIEPTDGSQINNRIEPTGASLS